MFDSVFGIHERALELRSQRMEVLSRNIANADTPNFKARDLDFSKVLSETQENQTIQATHKGHIGGSGMGRTADMVYTIPFNNSVDGNTVELSVEQAKYGKAAAQYQATLSFIEGNISGIRKALRGD